MSDFQKADLILWPRWLVTMDPEVRAEEGRGVVVRDGAIIDLIDAEGVTEYEAAEEMVLPEHVLMPGMVNTHTHAAMVLLRGIGDDMALMPWLEQRIWPAEQSLVSAEFVADGTRQAIAEMLRSGTTCARDMYFFPHVAASVAQEAGFRLGTGFPVLEFPTAWGRGPDDYLAHVRDRAPEIQGHPLTHATIAPHAPYTVADATFERIAALADELQLGIDIHLHETQGEVDEAVAQHGERPFARLDRLGLLGPRLLAVHMTALNESEIARCGELALAIAHCPESNMKLASGICPTPALLQAGACVSLGTDGAASNNDLDMIGEMRSAALLAKVGSGDASALNAKQALHAATLGGARALGLDQQVGSITAGKRADLVAVSLAELESHPVFDPVSHLVYATTRNQVTDVWIDGHRVLNDRRCTTLDERELHERARHWQSRVRESLT